MARQSGAIDWIVHRALSLVGGRVVFIPWMFFALAVVLGSTGSSLSSLALAPVAMMLSGRHLLSPMLMALTTMLGGGAGGFAPTSLSGVITSGVTANPGFEPRPWLLFGVTLGFNALLFAAVAIPLIEAGGVSGIGLIMALAISSNLVDSTPFSSPGATCIANAEKDQRPQLTALMLRWGFSMIVIGPALTVTTLVMTGV